MSVATVAFWFVSMLLFFETLWVLRSRLFREPHTQQAIMTQIEHKNWIYFVLLFWDTRLSVPVNIVLWLAFALVANHLGMKG